MTGDGALERLSAALREAAQRAVDRAQWEEATRLARELLSVDPGDRLASALLQFAEARGRTGDADQGRRFLTVMFSDLVGSTPLSERLDPEEYLAVIVAYQEVVRSTIARHDGHIEQFQGDGVVAYFGYPTASEADQVQAIEAGLEIVRGVEATSEELGVELAARVGIHVGRAILTAPMLGARHESAAVGFAANVAARIQAVARPGTVVISDAMAEHAAAYFDLQPVGERELRGVTEGVRVLEVRGIRARSTLADARLTAPLIDRDGPRAAIDSAWAAACEQREEARVVVLVGQPGIGKSRLVRYATERAAAPGSNLIEINCGQSLRAVGLGATREGIAKALHLPVGASPELAQAAVRDRAVEVGLSDRSRAVLESLVAGQSAVGASPELSPSALREAVIGALLEWIGAEASVAPTLLVVEDLHWADDTAVETIRRLLAAKLPPGLAVLLTSRDEGFPPALAGSRSGSHELAALTADETVDLVRALAGPTLDHDAAIALAARSEGVPLFTEHLAMAATGATGTAGIELTGELPDRIEALLQARLDGTGAGRPVAEVAAVVGREFSVDVVEWTLRDLGPRSPIDPDGVATALRVLERAGLIERYGPDRMRFCHSLVRDAAYELQLRSERPIRHRTVAAALLALKGTHAEPESLAYHYERAGDRDLAAAAHIRAAARAGELAEFDLALTHLRAAVDLVSGLDGVAARRLELDARMQIGATYAASFSYGAPEGVDAYRRALELCDLIAEEEGDDPGLLLPVVSALGGLWSKEVVAGDMVAASFVSDRIERVLDKVASLDPEVRRFGLSCRGLEQLFQGSTVDAIDTLEEAALLGHAGPISVGLGTPHDFVAANDSVLAVARTLRGDDVGADAAIEQAVARTRELAFPVGPFSEAVVNVYVAYVHRLRRDVDGARRAAQRISEIGARHGFQEHAMVGQMLGMVADATDGGEGARQTLAMMLSAWRAAGGGLAVPVLLTELAEACLRAGELDAARRALEDAATVMEETDQRAAEPEILRLRALTESAAAADEAVAKGLVAAAEAALAQGAIRLAARSLTDLRARGPLTGPALAVARRLRDQIPPTASGDLRDAAGWLSAEV